MVVYIQEAGKQYTNKKPMALKVCKNAFLNKKPHLFRPVILHLTMHNFIQWAPILKTFLIQFVNWVPKA